MLDKKADEFGLESNLVHNFTPIFVKAIFKKEQKEYFMGFDADDRLELIESILMQEIDFEYYVETHVILEHFPLHKRNSI